MRRTRDTQREAYEDLKSTLSEKLGLVYLALETQGPMASFQLAQFLGWPINCISGKITVLCDQNRVCDSNDRVINPRSGKKCILWRVKNAQEENTDYPVPQGREESDRHDADHEPGCAKSVSQ